MEEIGITHRGKDFDHRVFHRVIARGGRGGRNRIGLGCVILRRGPGGPGLENGKRKRGGKEQAGAERGIAGVSAHNFMLETSRLRRNEKGPRKRAMCASHFLGASVSAARRGSCRAGRFRGMRPASLPLPIHEGPGKLGNADQPPLLSGTASCGL